MSTERIIIGGTDCTDRIKHVVDNCPPLTDEQRARLALLLRPPGRVDLPAHLKIRTNQ